MVSQDSGVFGEVFSSMNADFWNQRFASADYFYGTEPNAFLVSQRQYLQPGMRALAVADGEGRNGVWLAQQGLEVLSVDASEVGLRKARELAARRGVSLRTQLVELTTWTWPEAEFDVVVAVFIHFPPEHRARMHEKMLRALKPGGVLILEAFTPQQLRYKTGGPPVAEMLYTAQMLHRDFSGAEILQLQETLADLQEGSGHRGTAAVVRLVLRRPAPR
jgi:cyclopropane fatty-acyl-phospholipid synthase-like methyltransferase